VLTHADGRIEFDEPKRTTNDEPGCTRTAVCFSDLPGNTVHQALQALDRKLTPNQGLRRLATDGTLVPVGDRMQGKTLLVVHGTFSNSDNVLAGIAEGDPELLRWAQQRYSQVLTFDYASLSGRSVSSAMALQRTIQRQVDGDIDLLCHSQGGLIARYWLERLDPARLESSRVVFVGSPLAGTSLASPSNLRDALRLLAGVASLVGVGAQVVSGLSLLGAVGGLAGVLQKTLGMRAIGGLIDAAVGVIPGVDSM
jgi:triacylglycerol esterase/lipase EstA (alpha/beta hydrolase family)